MQATERWRTFKGLDGTTVKIDPGKVDALIGHGTDPDRTVIVLSGGYVLQVLEPVEKVTSDLA